MDDTTSTNEPKSSKKSKLALTKDSKEECHAIVLHEATDNLSKKQKLALQAKARMRNFRSRKYKTNYRDICSATLVRCIFVEE